MPKYAVSQNKMNVQTLESPSFFNFIQAHTLEARKTYGYYFSNYLWFNQIEDSDVLLQKTPKEIEQNLIKYILQLKESGLAPNAKKRKKKGRLRCVIFIYIKKAFDPNELTMLCNCLPH